MKLPDGFKEEMTEIMGEEASILFSALEKSPEISVKLNRRKTVDPGVLGYPNPERVAWCRSGYYLDSRPKFTLNPLLHAGVFYVQEASSMIYESIMENIIPMAFDTSSRIAVADLCAAPGGKTTSIINALPDGALVVANEFSPQRVGALKENLLKWGYPEIVITNSPVEKFTALGCAFDIVTVDAPCSGEGMMRKEAMASQQWSEKLVDRCADLQRDILRDAIKILKPGGFLIYSTCTFNRKENEEQVKWLVEEMGLAAFNPGIPEDWNVMKGIETPYPCFRFMPHHTRGEGLFVAAFRKETDCDEAVIPFSRLKEKLKDCVKVICDGIPKKGLKGKDMVPTSQWALSSDFPADQFPSADLDLQDALSYLRHEAIRLSPDIGKGFVVVKYNGFPLGLVKNIGSRANNLYPSEWRIRNL